MTKKEMENKKAECIAAGRVKVVEKTDAEEALLEFFRNYKEPWLLVITASNKELLLDYTEIKDCNGVFVKAYCTWRNEDEALILLHIKCDCFNDENGEFDDSLFWCSNFILRLQMALHQSILMNLIFPAGVMSPKELKSSIRMTVSQQQKFQASNTVRESIR